MSDSKVEKNRKPGKPKGSPKTGGRQKGTPNKNHSILQTALDQENFNLIAEFADLYERMDDVQKLCELKFLMRFVYQKLPEIAGERHEAEPVENYDTAKLLHLAKTQNG